CANVLELFEGQGSCCAGKRARDSSEEVKNSPEQPCRSQNLFPTTALLAPTRHQPSSNMLALPFLGHLFHLAQAVLPFVPRRPTHAGAAGLLVVPAVAPFGQPFSPVNYPQC